MGMGFALTWLRQVSPPASHDHFNHWLGASPFNCDGAWLTLRSTPLANMCHYAEFVRLGQIVRAYTYGGTSKKLTSRVPPFKVTQSRRN